MMNRRRRSTRRQSLAARLEASQGQAIVILAVGLVALLGITGLAIDAGGLFFLQRDAQNAVDAAAVAAAHALCQGNSIIVAEDEAESAARLNGFEHNVNRVSLSIENPPADLPVGAPGDPLDYVKVKINAVRDTSFVQLVYQGASEVTVDATVHCTPQRPAVPGYAIMALGATCNDTLDSGVLATGNGDVTVTGGGIWSNCPGSYSMSRTGNSLFTVNGAPISLVGEMNYQPPSENCSTGHVTPCPDELQTQITDPLAGIPEPSNPGNCVDVDLTTPGTYTLPADATPPGTFNAADWVCFNHVNIAGQASVTFEPGNYYIVNDLTIVGQSDVFGNDVFFYVENGASRIEGSPTDIPRIEFTAPSSGPWRGMLLFSGRGNTNVVRVAGNGDTFVSGTIYAPDGTIEVEGNGLNDLIRAQMIGDRVQTVGNGELILDFDVTSAFYFPPALQVTE